MRVAWTLVREALRAAASPLHLAVYLIAKKRWQMRVRAALQSEPPDLTTVGDSTPPREPTTVAPIDTGKGKPHILLSAGETSGEEHAVRLMQAVRASGTEVRWTCFGGSRMEQEGGQLAYPLCDLAVMGFWPALRTIPEIVKVYRSYRRILREDPPDLVVLVDYPGLHLVLAEEAHRQGISVLHYIAPQYWAWAPWRVHRYRRCIDHSFTILPFEVAYFRDAGVPNTYVGHPLADLIVEETPDSRTLETVRARPTLCLLPGSRRREVEVHLRGMLRVAERVRALEKDLRVVIPHRSPKRASQVREILDQLGATDVEIVDGLPGPWMAGSRVVLAKSGTGSLEACMHGTPTVVVYKLPDRRTLRLYTALVATPYFASANLVAGREIVPEFAFADDSTWEEIADTVLGLWAEGTARKRCLADLKDMHARLGAGGASARAAAAVVDRLRTRGDPT